MSELYDRLFVKENIDAFKSTFKTKQGKQTLDCILLLGGFYDDNIKDEQMQGKRNFCTTILKFMGVSQTERSGEVVEAITDALVNLPTEYKSKKTGGSK